MFNKSTWSKVIHFHDVRTYPELPCPYCGSDTLKLDDDSFQFRSLSGVALKSYIKNTGVKEEVTKNFEDNALMGILSLCVAYAENKDFKPAQFTAFFKCRLCSESVTSIGIAQVPADGIAKCKKIKVEFFNPPVPMFELNSTTPSSINEELRHAFNYFHSDLSSSGAKLRRAMEKLCFETDCRERNLNRNIQEFSKLYPQEGGWLKSLKLVGNEATHSDGVSEDDILSSFQIFEVVLDIFRRKEIELKINKTVLMLESRYK